MRRQRYKKLKVEKWKLKIIFSTKAFGCWPLVIIPLTLVIRHLPFVLFFGRSGYRRRAFRSIFVCCAPQRMPLQSLTHRVKKRIVLFHSIAPVETRQRCNLYIKTNQPYTNIIVDASHKNNVIHIHKTNGTTKKMRRVNVCLFLWSHWRVSTYRTRWIASLQQILIPNS